jgi:hypothetical protein
MIENVRPTKIDPRHAIFTVQDSAESPGIILTM